MKMRNLALPAALLLAVLAAAAMLLYTSTVKHDSSTDVNTFTVVVFMQYFPAGTQLDALIDNGTPTTQQIPQNYVAPGALTSLDDLRGTTNSQAIVKGEQVIKDRIAELGAVEGGSLGIPDGYTAMTVQLQSAEGVGQAVTRGDHVRVLATFHGLGTATEVKTVALIQDVQVLDAVTLGDGESKSDNVLYTLAVSPQDAGKLAYAIDNATVYFSLLPPGGKVAPMQPVTTANVAK